MNHPQSRQSVRHSPGKNEGFTLVETIVAAALFMVIVTTITGIFIQVLGLQRRANGAARVQENALFVVETVAREIRVSTVVSPVSDCSSGSAPVESSTITIDHPVNGQVVYRLNGGIVERQAGGSSSPITSEEVEFTDLTFIVNCTAGDDEQARVTLTMTVQNKTNIVRNQAPMTLQTTVVSRDLVTDLTN